MTEVYVALSLAIIFLVLCVFGLAILRERDHDRWAAERKELNNRIMARTWNEYVAMQQADAQQVADTASAEEKEARRTSDYSGAWTA